LSLNDAKYTSDKGTRREKSRIDYIADFNNLYEEIKDTSFSTDMLQVLSTLSSSDLSFIMLKYQENYSDNDLAIHFNLTVEEVNQKDISILSLLKNNDNVKALLKVKRG
jgi:hypothetical protein